MIRGSRGSRARLAGALAGLAVLVSACGSGAEAGDDQAEGTDRTVPEETSSAAPAPQERAAEQDVKITSCEQTAYVPRATLEVTNSTSEVYRYAVTVTITNSKGDSTDAYFVERSLQPGKTVTEQIPGSTPVPGEVDCEVTEAKRLPPQ